MERNVRAGVGVRIGREVAGVGLAADLEDGERDALRNVGATGEPLAVGPGLEDGLGVGVAFGGERLDVLDRAKDEQGLFEAVGGQRAELRVGKQANQELDV